MIPTKVISATDLMDTPGGVTIRTLAINEDVSVYSGTTDPTGNWIEVNDDFGTPGWVWKSALAPRAGM
jgi:hypothetical protein